MSTLGGNQTLTIISESGLYAAIFKSRREEALRFRKWVTSEVLPAIRKTGRFVMHEADPGDIPALGDEGIAELTAKVGLIREARQVWGRHVVQSIWISIGLPAPIAISEVVDHGDPMLPEIKNFISDRDEVTMGELHDALGIPHNRRSNATSRRIGEAMRLIGWRRIVAKRAGAVTRVWVSPAKLGTLAAKGE